MDKHVTIYFDAVNEVPVNIDAFVYVKKFEGKEIHVRLHQFPKHNQSQPSEFYKVNEIVTSLMDKMDTEKFELLFGRFQLSYVDLGIWNRKIEHASWEAELIEKYRGWYFIRFERGFENLFQSADLRQFLALKNIYHAYDFDWPQVFVFFKDLNEENFLQAYKNYRHLGNVSTMLQERVAVIEEKFFKEKVWETIFK